MTKSLNVLFSRADEEALDLALKRAVPNVRYLDGQRWPTEVPPEKMRISECNENSIYFWDPAICPVLPCKQLSSGLYQGPTSGVVIQYCRCTITKDQISSGTIGIGYASDDEALADFVTKIWKSVKSLNSRKIARFVIGKGVLDLVAQGLRVPELPAASFE